MMGRVEALFRNPVKSIGIEALTETTLTAGHPMPGDRAFALRHEAAPQEDGWQSCRNFIRVTAGPELAAVRATSLAGGHLNLTHPDRPDLTFDPNDKGPKLLDWVRPLWPDNRPGPAQLVKSPAIGMGDNGLAQVSLLNLSSLRALSQKVGQPLEVERFRGNIVFDGLGPWVEFDMVGKRVQIGAVTLEVTDRIERCRATEANTRTGKRDANTLRALNDGWGHQDFGVYASVVEGGPVAIGDTVTF
ncbi:MAG: MOSC domain-containing protein [Rhodobacteraceae bacterium]|nr:MOSC domain-containing protein [Paracoccaceae bacterium]